jgi:hypothetical protein
LPGKRSIFLASGKALIAIEQLGGKNPNAQRSADAGPSALLELRSYGYESIADLVAKATANAIPCEAKAKNASPGSAITLATLTEAYKKDSRYEKLKYKVRENYDGHLRRINRDVGHLPLNAVTVDDVQAWHRRWSASGKRVYMGNAALTYVRMLFGFGAAKFDDRDCIRLSVGLRVTRFKKHNGSTRRQISSAQVIAFRKEAHKMELPARALATALQFEA